MPDSPRFHAWISPETDPAWHSALEEAVLRNSDDHFLLLWVSPRSLHAGKNQNLWSQVCAKAVRRDRVPVYRRLSGGGTVYHDDGNLNFSLVSTGEPRIDFCKHLGTILPFFERRGIPAEIRNRSDLFCNGKKFSGNAEYFSGGRVLHHGTLLFDANLEAMQRYLTPDTGPYEDRAIDSNRSRTQNLRPLLPDIGSVQKLATALVADLRERDPRWSLLAEFPDDLKREARELRSRFDDPAWIFGRSPAYRLERVCGDVRSRLEVKRGRISDLQIDWAGHAAEAEQVSRHLSGVYHAPDPLFEALRSGGVDERLTRDEFWLDLFF